MALCLSDRIDHVGAEDSAGHRIAALGGVVKPMAEVVFELLDLGEAFAAGLWEDSVALHLTAAGTVEHATR